MDTDFEYETLHNKIQQLKKASIIENDISSKFKLEQQIKDAEQELVELESKLIALEKNRIILKLNGSNHQVYCIFSKQATIGRASTCDFVINDDYHQISNLHAGIFYNLDKNEYWIEDLNSANGTYIDEAKIEKPTQLAWNAKIKLGTSLSFVFQHNKDDSLSPAVLIQHDPNGEEIARYIVIPKGKVLVGTNPKEVVRFPKLRDERSLGSIERKTDGFYFISVDNQETLLKHNIELSLDFLKVRITIPSVVQKQVNDDTIIAESTGNTSNLLYLRVLGTPYAYQAPYGLENISIGRQRRKSGTSLDAGNDVVIRVPGADPKSLRISRKHLEIKRIDTEYFVIDKSRGHTKLNGKFLKENDPLRLQTGDRLLIADVLTLEVIVQTKISGIKVGNIIRIDSHNTIQDGLLIEASIGDLITEVSYE